MKLDNRSNVILEVGDVIVDCYNRVGTVKEIHEWRDNEHRTCMEALIYYSREEVTRVVPGKYIQYIITPTNF